MQGTPHELRVEQLLRLLKGVAAGGEQHVGPAEYVVERGCRQKQMLALPAVATIEMDDADTVTVAGARDCGFQLGDPSAAAVVIEEHLAKAKEYVRRILDQGAHLRPVPERKLPVLVVDRDGVQVPWADEHDEAVGVGVVTWCPDVLYRCYHLAVVLRVGTCHSILGIEPVVWPSCPASPAA